MPEKTGSQCISCSDRKVRERREAFATANQTAPTSADANSGSTPAWPQDASKADCERYILGAPELALPSVCTKTCQAMYGLKGRKNWHTVAPKLDTSGISAQQKLGYLQAARADLSLHCLATHPPGCPVLGGPLRPVSAQYKQRRCINAGEVIGWDLKSIVPSKPKILDHAAGSLLYFPQSVGLGLGPQAGAAEALVTISFGFLTLLMLSGPSSLTRLFKLVFEDITDSDPWTRHEYCPAMPRKLRLRLFLVILGNLACTAWLEKVLIQGRVGDYMRVLGRALSKHVTLRL
ncbi:unnamed protein product [Cladocopium goreaui]|uniref:Uncharacterized protein n=1 Tax=Cladocopium goreaui TaxID=2562237 RepID=A0A9P1BSN6_9DINO|nr:unnamed protein product [Cladocopium goreaui]